MSLWITLQTAWDVLVCLIIVRLVRQRNETLRFADWYVKNYSTPRPKGDSPEATK